LKREGETVDDLLGGRLRIFQKEKVNAVLEKKPVKNIYFSIGIIGSASPKDKRGMTTDIGQYPLKERDKKLIEKSLASIPDEEVNLYCFS